MVPSPDRTQAHKGNPPLHFGFMRGLGWGLVFLVAAGVDSAVPPQQLLQRNDTGLGSMNFSGRQLKASGAEKAAADKAAVLAAKAAAGRGWSIADGVAGARLHRSLAAAMRADPQCTRFSRPYPFHIPIGDGSAEATERCAAGP